MAFNFNDTFSGVAVDAAKFSVSTTPATDASVTFSGGIVTFSHGTSPSACKLISVNTYNWDDGENIVLKMGASAPTAQNFVALAVVAADASFAPAVSFNGAGGLVRAIDYRSSDNTGAATGATVSGFFQFMRMTRSGTSVVFSCSTDGSAYTPISTIAAGAFNWTSANFTAARIHIVSLDLSGTSKIATFDEFNPIVGGGAINPVIRRRRSLV